MFWFSKRQSKTLMCVCCTWKVLKQTGANNAVAVSG